MARIWNKYPYTDFHELNLSWVIDKITDFEARLVSVEEDVADLKTRMTSVEGRITTAEERIARHDSDIAGLSSAVGGIRDRVTTLENADIQGAAMLESVSSVEAGNAYVTLNFSAAEYNEGEKTAGTDSAVIPAATNSKAGVMLPGEKAKLDLMNILDGDIVFSGTARGSDPTNNADFATKQYVDSMAITGSAEVNRVINNTVHWKEGLTQVDTDSFIMWTYGKVAQVRTTITHILDSERSYGSAMFTCSGIPVEYAGSIYENLTAYNETDGTLIPCRVQGFANDPGSSTTCNITIIPLVTVPAGKKITIFLGFAYLILG